MERVRDAHGELVRRRDVADWVLREIGQQAPRALDSILAAARADAWDDWPGLDCGAMRAAARAAADHGLPHPASSAGDLLFPSAYSPDVSRRSEYLRRWMKTELPKGRDAQEELCREKIWDLTSRDDRDFFAADLQRIARIADPAKKLRRLEGLECELLERSLERAGWLRVPDREETDRHIRLFVRVAVLGQSLAEAGMAEGLDPKSVTKAVSKVSRWLGVSRSSGRPKGRADSPDAPRQQRKRVRQQYRR